MPASSSISFTPSPSSGRTSRAGGRRSPETISVWKRHPQFQRELDRWRELAETPLDATEMRLKLEALEAMTTALEQLQLLMGATKPVRTGGTLSEVPVPPDTGRSPHPTPRPLTAAPA